MNYKNNEENYNEHIIEGRNSVFEAIRAGRTIDKLYYLKSEADSFLNHIAFEAKKAGAVLVAVDRKKLDQMSQTHAHQGVIASCAAYEYSSVEEILDYAKETGRPPLIVVCDELSDPHNLGAIIRSAEAAGAHGVIIPKRRSATLTATVSKASAGAIELIKIARVSNIPTLLDELKDKGLWIYGTGSTGAESVYQIDLTGPICLVIGSEGEGMGQLVSKKCDFIIKIPMLGKMESLNASNATAVILFEILRQREGF